MEREEFRENLKKVIKTFKDFEVSGDLFYCMECHITYKEIPKKDCGSERHPMIVEQCVCGYNSFEPLSNVIDGLEKELSKSFES